MKLYIINDNLIFVADYIPEEEDKHPGMSINMSGSITSWDTEELCGHSELKPTNEVPLKGRDLIEIISKFMGHV
jgi:hypothetical protein